MAANRKLQTEIQQVLKKVDEGVALFNETWDKVYSADTQQLKEKYEADLKKEIKKLQRLRDQIKTWISGNEIKDKTQLIEARKTIESKMEQFKVCERDTKTKAYSKEGLARDAKLDPKEIQREEKRAWLNECLDRLYDLNTTVEAEKEKLSGGKSKSKNKEELIRLENRLQKQKWHIAKMELIIKLIDTEELDPSSLDSVKDSVEYYLETAADDDGQLGVEHEFDIYEDLALDSFNVGPGAFEISPRPHGAKDEEDGTPTPSGSNGSATAAAAAAPAAGAAPTGAVSALPPPAAGTAVVVTPHATVAVTSNTTTIIEHKAPPKGGEAAAAAKDAATPADKRAAASAPSVAQVLKGSKQAATEANAPSTAAAAKKDAPTAAAATTAAASSTSADASDAKSGNQRNVAAKAEPAASAKTAATAAAGKTPPVAAATLKSPPAAAQQSPVVSGVSPPPPSAAPVVSPTGQTAAAKAAAPSTATPSASSTQSGSSTQSTTATAPSNTATPASVASTTASGPAGLVSPPVSAALPPAAAAPAAAVPPAASSASSVASTPVLSATVAAAPPSATAAASVLTPEVQQTLALLKQSMLCMPEEFQYLPRNPNPNSHPSFPTQPPLTNLADYNALFEKLPLETMFFAFYFQPSSYQQTLAARKLKKNSWRYHKKHAAWFQRHSEPKSATLEYEEGAYLVFEHEVWSQRVKPDFKFEYAFLEDELN